MPQLAVPHTGVHASFVAAMAEFRAEGRGGPDDDSTIGRDLRESSGRRQRPEGFADYVAAVVAESRPDVRLPEGRVRCTTLWWTDGETYLGRLAIRHTLNDWLLQYGGHIGYDVRPTARRRGHATAMPRAALPVARGLGVERALITCDHDNAGSRKVIEACGGVLEDRRGDKLRFRVATGTA